MEASRIARVAALAPTYNRAAMLTECINSLLAQTRPLDEIIVIDDGSTDDTPALLTRYAPPVRVLRQDNAGKAAALNHGLSVCRADYVWICDDDDIAAPGACAALLAALEREPGAGFAYGRFDRFRVGADGERETLAMSYWPEGHRDAFFLEMLERCFVFQYAMLVRRSVYEALGPFNTALLRSQDYEMMLRIARENRGVFVDDVMFHQREHAGQRGAALDRFSVRAAEEKWLAYDRVIFTDLRARLALDELVPPFAREVDARGRERAALLQRACIFGRHAMWREAIDDLRAAAAASPAPAARQERVLARRMLMDERAFPSLAADAQSLARLRESLDAAPFLAEIGADLVRPMYWQMRAAIQRGDLESFASRARFLVRMRGPIGAVSALARKG